MISKQLIGGFIFVSPLLVMFIFAYIAAWAKAIDDYKKFDDESGLIVMSLFTIFLITTFIGSYLMIS